MIVVDTNILINYYVNSEGSDLASQVYTKDPAWVAPFLWRSEFRNTTLLYLHKKLLTLQQVLQIIQAVERMMQDHEFHVGSSDIYRLAANSSCSAYDCEFVALAQELGITLVTADKKVLREFSETAVSPLQFIETNH